MPVFTVQSFPLRDASTKKLWNRQAVYTSMIVNPLAGVIIYRLKADTEVCLYESHLSLKHQM